MVPILTKLFNSCLQEYKTTPDGGKEIIITLFKGGDSELLWNWSLINLSNCSHKLLTKILPKRLLAMAKEILSQNQFGFISGKKIGTNIKLTRNVIQSSTFEGALVFLDQDKAYDRVGWDYLSLVLELYNIDQRFIKFIKNWLEATSF